MKKVAGARWSKTLKSWHIPDTPENRAKCGISQKGSDELKAMGGDLQRSHELRDVSYEPGTGNLKQATGNKKQETVRDSQAYVRISDDNKIQLQKFIQQLNLKAYSASTIKTYRNEFMVFLQTIRAAPAESLTVQRIKDYLEYCYVTLKLTENTIHSRMNALKFYYEQVLGKEKFFWEIPRPKKAILLPKVFSQDDIAAIIKSVTNIKHKVMLMLAYSAGLRISEVVALKTYEIDSKRMHIFISRAKGKKDRLATLSPVLLVMLREYALQYKPNKKGYLFEGSNKDTAYSTRSLQEVLQAAKKKAGVMRPGSIHSLRHSFATHLIERGTDVTMIQKLLGHNDIKTTLRYLHTSNKDLLKIISPLDDLDLG